MNHLKLVVLSVLAACAADSSTDPDSGVTQGPKQVTLQFPNQPPTFVAVREGSGAWQAMQPPYQATLNGEVSIAVVCATGTGYYTTLMHSTSGELSAMPAFYCGTAPQPSTVEVMGEMAQPGTLALWSQQTGTTAPWSFDFHIAPGPHDLIAYDSSRVLIRRDLSITTNMTLPTTDLTGAASLVRVPATVQGATSAEKLDVFVDWQTANASTAFDDRTTTLIAPPSSLVASGDKLTAEAMLTASSGSTYTDRFAWQPFTGSETAFQMPPLLTGVTFAPAGAPPSASWGSLPDHQWVSFGAYTATNQLSVEDSSGWLAAHPASSISFDDEPPGYQPSWRVALSGPYTCGLYVGTKSDATYLTQMFGG